MNFPSRAGASRHLWPLAAILLTSLTSYFQPTALTDVAAVVGFKTPEQIRRDNNKVRLAKMNPYMQRKVGAIVADLEGHGYYPVVDAGVYRTPAEQLAKYSAGYSKVKWSFHNASTPAGKPDSLAADVFEQRYGWSSAAPRAYTLKLLSSAQSHGVTTGAFWGLTTAQRKSLQTAVSKKDWDKLVAIGWDDYHIEPATVTVAQARNGKRPK